MLSEPDANRSKTYFVHIRIGHGPGWKPRCCCSNAAYPDVGCTAAFLATDMRRRSSAQAATLVS